MWDVSPNTTTIDFCPGGSSFYVSGGGGSVTCLTGSYSAGTLSLSSSTQYISGGGGRVTLPSATVTIPTPSYSYGDIDLCHGMVIAGGGL